MRRAALAVVAVAALTACGSSATTGTPAPASGTPKSWAVSSKVLSVHLPVALARAGVVDLGGGKVVVLGGMVAGNGSSNQVSQIDFNAGSVSALPSLAVNVHDLAGGRWNGQLAAFGGGNATEQSVVQAYDGHAWKVVAHMPTTRSDLVVVEIEGTTYIVGGYDGTGQPTDILKAGSLAKAGSLPVGARYQAPAVVGKQAYLFGGEAGGAMLDVVQRFDPATGKIDVVAHLPHALGHAMAATIGGRVLVFGGRTSQTTQTDAMWWFEPATNRFTSAGTLPSQLTDAAAVVAPDSKTIWVIGGEHPKVTDEILALTVN